MRNRIFFESLREGVTHVTHGIVARGSCAAGKGRNRGRRQRLAGKVWRRPEASLAESLA